MDGALRRKTYDTIEELNRLELGAVGDPEISTRIFPIRDGVSNAGGVPELMDISKDPPAIQRDVWNAAGKSAFANNAASPPTGGAGVRFVQLTHWLGQQWRHEGQ